MYPAGQNPGTVGVGGFVGLGVDVLSAAFLQMNPLFSPQLPTYQYPKQAESLILFFNESVENVLLDLSAKKRKYKKIS